jgi:hypothetical protein
VRRFPRHDHPIEKFHQGQYRSFKQQEKQTMSVRAKFRVQSITQYDNGRSIKLSPVTSGSKENEQFYKWTPGGSIELSTVNEEAAKQFGIGKEFYIDFTDATPAPEAVTEVAPA